MEKIITLNMNDAVKIRKMLKILQREHARDEKQGRDSIISRQDAIEVDWLINQLEN